VVYADQGSEAFRAQLVVKERPPRTFIDILFGSQGYDEQIAQSPGLFQVMDVPGMKKIESPMALNKPFALRPELVENPGGDLERKNLLSYHYLERKL
jgi:hypothetical protein